MVVEGERKRLLPELTKGRSYGQSFVAEQDNLCRIDILFATYPRGNTADIYFHLKESPHGTEDIVTLKVNASRLMDCQYHPFAFPPTTDSGKRTFYFYLESPESIKEGRDHGLDAIGS